MQRYEYSRDYPNIFGFSPIYYYLCGQKGEEIIMQNQKIKACLLTIVSVACMSFSQNQLALQGTYSAPNGTEVYLINLDNRDTLDVATVSDNKFAFTVQLLQPIYAFVGHDRDRVRFIMEPGTLMVNLDKRTFKGTPMADAYNDFHVHFYGYNMQRNKERKALTAIKETISPAEFNERWSQLDDKYRNLQGELTDSLVRLNNDNLLGAIALDDLALVDTTRFMQLYGMMSQEMQSFYMLKNDVKNIVLQSRTAPGKMFTDYLIKQGNLDGSDVSLSDYVGKGKYILLDHWASWCGPCKAEMPYIKKVWENFAGEHFDVVSIAVNDKRENTLRALKSLDMPWHQIIDAQRIPLSSYNISAIPHLILFAPDGTILKRGLRGEQIYTTIQQLLSDKAL